MGVVAPPSISATKQKTNSNTVNRSQSLEALGPVMEKTNDGARVLRVWWFVTQLVSRYHSYSLARVRDETYCSICALEYEIDWT
jgi:hypothetical protein